MNDPIDFVDPSGLVNIQAAMSFFASGGGGGGWQCVSAGGMGTTFDSDGVDAVCSVINNMINAAGQITGINGGLLPSFFTPGGGECDIHGGDFETGSGYNWYECSGDFFAPNDPRNQLIAANNGNPIVPANPCNRAGNAPDPSVYQAKGQAGSTNAFTDIYNLFQFRAGGGLDAQPQGASPLYANYAYGVYMSAAGYTLNQALSGADIYAQYRASYPSGTTMDPNHPFTPMVNVMNITYGFTAQQRGTLCHK